MIRTLLGFIRPFPWVLPVLTILGTLATLAEGLGIGLLIPFFQELLRDGMAGGGGGPFVGLVERFAGTMAPQTRMLVVGGAIIALIVVKSVIVFSYGVLSCWVYGRICHRLRVDGFRQLMEVGYAFFSRNDPGRLINTLSGETWRTSEALGALFNLVISACTTVVFTGLLLLISWPLTLSVVVGVLAASLVIRLVTRQVRALGEAAVQANRAMSERCVEGIGAMRMVRAFGQEERELRRYAEASEAVRRTFLRMERLMGAISPLQEVLYVPLFIATLLLAWHFQIGVPTLIAFLLLLYRLQPHIKNLDQQRVRLAALAGAADDVAALIDRRDKPYIRSGSVPFERLDDAITFQRVGFRYAASEDGENAEGRPALQDVSFRIVRGEVTAVVGGSGAGKSTLINLLYRFYDPGEGVIQVDGRPLPDLNLAAWRRAIAMAGQDAELMNGTIGENIAYGQPDADPAAVIAAATQADAHAFITTLPQGYDTRVGDRGLRLSGGQRQRIGLARALLRQPDLLILDEATNALDSLSEQAIQETLERLAGHLTIVVIAHRLSTIRNADHVIVLDQGRIVEDGRPDDLFRANGTFARLYRLQVSALSG